MTIELTKMGYAVQDEARRVLFISRNKAEAEAFAAREQASVTKRTHSTLKEER